MEAESCSRRSSLKPIPAPFIFVSDLLDKFDPDSARFLCRRGLLIPAPSYGVSMQWSLRFSIRSELRAAVAKI